MLNNPLQMLYEDSVTKTTKELLVYDFIHENSYCHYAFCWDTQLNCWFTVPVTTLRPLIKKSLND